MKTITLCLIAVTMLFTACGPDARATAEAKRSMIDSVTTATEVATANKIQHVQSLNDSLVSLRAEKDFHEAELTLTKGELAAAYDKMARIKEFQFGRAAATRESQIRDQAILIDELEKQERELRTSLEMIDATIARVEDDLKLLE